MTELNRRLTAQDAGFLYTDRPNQPMHGAGIAIYEGDLSLETFTRIMEERLHLAPRYRQVVVSPPFGIAHPTWEDDQRFDIQYHIVEETIPPPGDDRALAEVVGRLMAPQMDRTRPLWKTVVLRGRADGNTAVISMVHHAMIDGVSGVDLTLLLHDLTPNAEPPPAPAEPWRPAPMPDPISLLQDAVRDQLVAQAERWTEQTFERFRPAEAAERTQQISSAMTSSMPSMLQPAPRTSFNGTVSRQRAVSWAQYSFTEIRAIRAALGGTINDVVLTVIAGALAKYLAGRGEPTRNVELRAMCPVSMRGAAGRNALGNQVSMMIAPLYIGISDPVERMQAERAAMERLKEQNQAGAFYAMTQQGDQTPPWIAAMTGQMETQNTMLNTVSTNIPGPQIPLYMAGHKLLESFSFGMLSANIGIFNAVVSYNQTLTIGVTVDPTQVPDAWRYAKYLEESFAELRDGAARVAAAKVNTTESATTDAKPARTRRRATART